MFDPTPIIIVSVVVPLVLTFGILFWLRNNVFGMSKQKQALAENIITTGSKARAKVLRVQPTGMIVNEINIQCLVDFQLEPIHGGAPFAGQKKMMINQTQMPRVGDVWPCWYNAADATQFVVGMPDGASQEQVPVFREFGIPHPLDPSSAAAAGGSPSSGRVADLERLSAMRRDGTLTEAEFQAEKTRLMGS